MSDFDVSLRMRLNEDLSKKGPKARKAIKDLAKDLKKLDMRVGSKLSRELERMAGASRKAKGGIDRTAAAGKNLNKIRTDKAEQEIKALGKAAGKASADLIGTMRAGRRLNQLRTDKAEQEIKALGKASDTVRGKLKGVETRLKGLNRVRTDKAEQEMRSLGKAADATARKVRSARTGVVAGPGKRVPGKVAGAATRAAESAYDRTAVGTFVPLSSGGAVATGAGVAAGGIAAGRSFKNYAGFERWLSNQAMSLGASEDEGKAFGTRIRQLAIKRGIPNKQMAAGVESIIAAGAESTADVERLLDPTMVSAMGGGAPVLDMANTLKAVSDHLGVAAEDMTRASDRIISGGRLGKFEVEDMARYLPTGLPLARNQLGYKGIEGLEKVAADLQIIRAQSGTSSEAFTRWKDFASKIFMENVQKNFKKKAGLDLKGAIEGAVKSGGDPIEAAVSLVRKAIAKDATILPRLFPEQDSRLGAQALAFPTKDQGRDFYISEMRKAEGTTEKSFARVANDAQASIDRLSNAADNAAYALGGLIDRYGGSTALNAIAGATNKYAEQGVIDATLDAWKNVFNRYVGGGGQPDKRTDTQKLQNRRALIASQIEQLDGKTGAALAPLSRLREELSKIDQQLRQAAPRKGKAGPEPDRPLVPRPKPQKPRASLPIDAKRQAAALSKDLSGAADKAMDGYNAKLAAEGQRAVATAQTIANSLKATLSFTATPTISPRYTGATPTGGGSAPAAKKTVRATNGRPVQVTQNISTSDPARAARYSQRQQNRAVRLTQAGALHDTGRIS